MLREVFKYKGFYLIGILALICVDLVQLRLPRLTARLTDGLTAGEMTSKGIMSIVMELLILGLFISVGRFVWRYFIFGTSRRVETNMRDKFFSHLEKLSTSFYNQNKTGDLMAYATNDLNAIRMMVGPGLLMALDALILTTLVLIQMITKINLRLTLLATIPLPFIAIGSLYMGTLIRKRFKDKQEAFAHLTDVVQENISGIRVVKAFVREAQELVKFNRANELNFEKNMHVVKLFAIMGPAIGLITGLAIAIALGVGGRMTMEGTISLGDFVAFIQYLLMLVWPMMAFGWCINIVSQGRASLERFEEILKVKPEIVDRENVVALTEVKGEIQLKNLSFSYEEGREAILDELHVKIAPGETLGILGRTGSGKTTLANLLLRIFDPKEGQIYIDGHDILSIPLKQLRENIGYVPQDNFLFSDTLTENIGFAYDTVTKEQVVEAALSAQVHDNIIDFPLGYETIVGERGVTLSGGQKQRVSIARALIKKPPILILDDAVSAVDTKTEEAILSYLKKERKNKTTILIAHRISTLQQADKILVIDKGRAIEYGTHLELVEQAGYYAKMVKKQQLEAAIDAVEV